MRRFVGWEDDLIRQHYRTEGIKFLLPILDHRSYDAIKARAGFLNVRRPPRRDWTLAEMKVLRRVFPDFDLAMQLLPGRTRAAIRERGNFMRLAPMNYWSGAEDDLVRKLAPTHTDVQIGAMLGRTARSVRARRYAIGISHKPLKRHPKPLLMVDLAEEATKRGVKLRTIANAMGLPHMKPSQKGSQIRTAAALVSAFQGEFYAEWHD